MKQKRKLKLDEYHLLKIEELASMCNSTKDIAAFFGVTYSDYIQQENSNPSMRLAFEMGQGKMTGMLSKRALQIALKSDDKNSLNAIQFILKNKDFKNWSEKYQERIHGLTETEDLPKINFVFSEKPKEFEQQASGTKNA